MIPSSPSELRTGVAQGLSTTAFHVVNAVPLVCEAPDPGIKTYLDLPMVTGCLGTETSTR